MGWELERLWEFKREDEAYENWPSSIYLVSLQILYLTFLFIYFLCFWRRDISNIRKKKTYLLIFLTDVGNGDQTELNTGGQSVKF